MAFSPTTLDLIVWNVEHGLSCTILTPQVTFFNGWGNVTRERLIQVDAGFNSDSNFSPLGQLYAWGHKKIDCLVISHPDNDHIDDLPHLQQTVHTLIRNKSFPHHLISENKFIEGPAKAKFRDLHTRYTADVYESWKTLTPENLGGVNVYSTYLSHEEGMDTNDTSVVMCVQYGNLQILFAGDITATSFDRLMALGRLPTPLFGGYRILVASHHGRASAEPGNMLEYFTPDLVLASAKDEDDYTCNLYSSSDKVGGLYINGDCTTPRKFVSTKGSKGIHLRHLLSGINPYPSVSTFLHKL